ncbi:MAG TPA: hypothetical protein VEP90_04600 [Methylomirabilota bacterium]|nr:hypothetical protein [Methylomirabilota bacterium]
MAAIIEDELKGDTPPYDFGPRRCTVCGCRFWSRDEKPNCPLCGGFSADEPFLAEKRARHTVLNELATQAQILDMGY